MIGHTLSKKKHTNSYEIISALIRVNINIKKTVLPIDLLTLYCDLVKRNTRPVIGADMVRRYA